MSTLGRAIEIAVIAHAGQTDKGGRPYILHPLWVMNKVRHLGDEYMIVAVLHDVIEDTGWSIRDLQEEGFSDNVIKALGYLDFRGGGGYQSRIELIATMDLAKQVKLRDIEHNSKVTRLKGLTKKDLDRTFKYHKAYTYLKSV